MLVTWTRWGKSEKDSDDLAMDVLVNSVLSDGECICFRYPCNETTFRKVLYFTDDNDDDQGPFALM